MARPRKFEIDDVRLEAAAQTFWKSGYECALLSTLTKALGLQKGSIYKAFRDKRTLFLMVLEHYLDQRLGMMSASLESSASPVEAIRDWGQALRALCFGARGSMGCLAINSMVELAPKDVEAAAKLKQHWEQVEGLLRDVLLRGQAVGEVRQDIPAMELVVHPHSLGGRYSRLRPGGVRRVGFDVRYARFPGQGERLVLLR